MKAAVDAALANPRLVELGLAGRTRQIETEALAIDERLVAAAALPERTRAEAVAAFEARSTALEDAVAALVQSVERRRLQGAARAGGLRRGHPLQALAEARAEVERIDRPDHGTATA